MCHLDLVQLMLENTEVYTAIWSRKKNNQNNSQNYTNQQKKGDNPTLEN